MRIFIKRGTQDKLLNQAAEGGGFQSIEVMVTNNFELAVPETERPYWIELYPGSVYFPIKINALQSGCLMGLITSANPQTQRILGDVTKQLTTLKKRFEEEAGVTKEVLPGGIIKSTDKDGTVIMREPMPHEIEGN